MTQIMNIIPLIEAVKHDDIKLLKILLKNSEIDVKDSEGLTGLMWAIKMNNLNIAKFLIENGANTKAKDNEGETALMMSACKDNINIAKLLIDSGINVRDKDFDGETALIASAAKNNKKIAEILINNGANIEAKDDDGVTALMATASEHSLDVAKFLIENNANIEAKDNGKKTALMWAALTDSKEVAKLLIDNNADIEAKDINKMTALMWAASENSIGITKLLINKNVNLEAKDNEGLTALMLSSIHNNQEVAKFLINNGINIETKDKNGRNALIWAALTNSKDVVQLIINKGGNIEAKDNKGNSVLINSIMHGSNEITKILLENNVNIQVKNNDGFHAIDYAYNYPKIRKLLIQNGSPVPKENIKNIIDNHTSSNLIQFTNKLKEFKTKFYSKGYEAIITNFVDLIEKDTFIITKSSPLIEAIKLENINLIKIFVKIGANLDFEDKDGFTAWDYATKAKNKESILNILNIQNEFKQPSNNPKTVVEILSNFTKDTPIKYTTHRWDFGDITKEYGGFDGFLEEVDTQWKEKLKDELKIFSPKLYEKIEAFLNLWKNTSELKEWCERGKDPFDFKNFRSEIEKFKHSIEIRTENNMLEEIFLELEEGFNTDHEIEHKKLKGKQFYTDVEIFKLTLQKIFSEIEKRDKHTKIVVEATNTTGEYIELTITHVGSYTDKSAEELLKEVDDGDFADIKKSLQNLCDWSVEDNKHRINYLVSDNSIEEIEELDEKVEGFRHLFRFYR